LDNWYNEFQAWAPDIVVVKYVGDQKKRKILDRTILQTRKFNVLLIQYEFVTKDKRILKKIDWQYIIIDEGHRIKNANCKLVKDLKEYNSKHRFF
jgi:SNF2 family DNA or RNA helicase